MSAWPKKINKKTGKNGKVFPGFLLKKIKKYSW